MKLCLAQDSENEYNMALGIVTTEYSSMLSNSSRYLTIYLQPTNILPLTIISPLNFWQTETTNLYVQPIDKNNFFDCVIEARKYDNVLYRLKR